MRVCGWAWALTSACIPPPPGSPETGGAPATQGPSAADGYKEGDAAILVGDVQSVDGQPLALGESEYRLSPGCHRIGMKQDFVLAETSFSVQGRMEPFDVDLSMKPGHRYTLAYRMSDGAAGTGRVAILAYEAEPSTNNQKRLPVVKARPGTRPCGEAR